MEPKHYEYVTVFPPPITKWSLAQIQLRIFDLGSCRRAVGGDVPGGGRRPYQWVRPIRSRNSATEREVQPAGRGKPAFMRSAGASPSALPTSRPCLAQST